MRTASYQVLQAFGLEYPNYKILVQAHSSNRYIIWYSHILEVDVGQEVPIDFNAYDDWQTVDNPRNGRKSSISKVSKVS
ncbi:MAG TPA: hypothetical protein VK211_25105 [Kamptonema sp.]|nr:hypothetical protein [Kamptonema sp.]